MEEIEVCYYCGIPASTVDHVIPKSILKKFDRGADPDAYDHFINKRQLLVPACTECNTLLGSSYQETLQERKKHLKTKLKQRYKKLLKMPYWAPKEIDELGTTLRQTILAGTKQQKLIELRILW